MLDIPVDGKDSFYSDYFLDIKIGEGTFSDVYKCVEKNYGRKMAAKILKNDYGPTIDADTWASINEVNVANIIERHPFLLIVDSAYHDIGTGRIVLVTELMKNSLYDVIESGECPLTDNRIKIYMYQLLEGLKYLHENNIIHRDIKPENILLCHRDLKIGDLGTAVTMKDGQKYTEYVSTRWYRSPECLLTRGHYGTKMDIWAAGCVLYEMATSKPLFDGSDEYDQMVRIEQILGKPDVRLLEKFKRHQSHVFVKRYICGKVIFGDRINSGTGLQAVFQPYRPGFELIKDMIVYDPSKRSTAERLLRKPYFFEMKNTQYEYKVFEFERRTNKTSSYNCLSSEEAEKKVPIKQCKIDNNECKRQGPNGDVKTDIQLKKSAHKDDELVLNDLHKRMAAVNLNSVKKSEKSHTYLHKIKSYELPNKQIMLTKINQEILIKRKNVVPKNFRPPFK
ncbi:MAPK/MAK/MRK overlapping kinase-like [Daktulosphaira vitifoliae]|uniref:MAPK/MAK/MRK overlapping kinase-like n=1 Tax=Daktulosphaira vitifoliae TaxID=58002 RepID=UPI0021AA0BF9|nr:MAPK/MAK/MRK overlapping kinase-like [Daktulosphaira vitifoliae]